MEDRTIELVIISAQDLKRVKNFGQQSCYAVAYIYRQQQKATRVDKDGSINPSWNEKISLTCDESLLQRAGACITVEIYSRGSFSNKLVGTVLIPLVDVAKEAKSEPKYMAFQVRRPSGKAKGILNLSVHLGEKRKVSVKDRDRKQSYAYSQPQGTAPVGYPPQKLGEDWSSQKPSSTYPPSSSSSRVDGGSLYPPASAGNGSTVYPSRQSTSVSAPVTTSSGSSSTPYPPPKNNSNSKVEEPVMAYPATGYPVGGYPPQQYGQQYPPQYSPQQYYPPPQATAPYNYQQAYYSRPPKRTGGSGMGMGLLGGALGGLLLGDMIGDMGGF